MREEQLNIVIHTHTSLTPDKEMNSWICGIFFLCQRVRELHAFRKVRFLAHPVYIYTTVWRNHRWVLASMNTLLSSRHTNVTRAHRVCISNWNWKCFGGHLASGACESVLSRDNFAVLTAKRRQAMIDLHAKPRHYAMSAQQTDQHGKYFIARSIVWPASNRHARGWSCSFISSNIMTFYDTNKLVLWMKQIV